MRNAFLSFDQITTPTEFETQALALFTYQYYHNTVYRSYCDLINKSPSDIKKSDDIPCLPIQFFKSHTICCETPIPKTYFSSSKTTGQLASKHYVKDIQLYIQSFVRTFTSFYGPVNKYAIIALLPSYLERNDSSLVYMAQHLIQLSKHPESDFYLNEWDTLHQVVHRLEQEGQPTLLLGVSFALLECVERFQWKLNNTIIMETGGMKGMRKEWIRSALHNRLKEGFGVSQIHSEYGMTELFSQAYAQKEGRFETPPWMKVNVRSAEDPFEYIGDQKTGALNIIDLANVDSCAFIATEDLGKTHADGSFEVLGRFDHAEIRGCNLLAL